MAEPNRVNLAKNPAVMVMSAFEWLDAERLALALALLGILVAILVPLGIEWAKRPSIRIEGAADTNQRTRQPHYRIVHIRVINQPSRPWIGWFLLRNTATSCRVTITFTSRSDGTRLEVPGRWSGAPEPLSWYPTGQGSYQDYDAAKVPQTLRFDLPADPGGEVVAVAIKLAGDSHAFAFTSESYEDPHEFRVQRFQLPDEEYDVSIVATAGEITAAREMRLENRGTGITGLTLG